MPNRSMNSIAVLCSEISTKTRVKKCDWQRTIRNPVFEHFRVSQRKEWLEKHVVLPSFPFAYGTWSHVLPASFSLCTPPLSSISPLDSAHLGTPMCPFEPELSVTRNLVFLYWPFFSVVISSLSNDFFFPLIFLLFSLLQASFSLLLQLGTSNKVRIGEGDKIQAQQLSCF